MLSSLILSMAVTAQYPMGFIPPKSTPQAVTPTAQAPIMSSPQGVYTSQQSFQSYESPVADLAYAAQPPTAACETKVKVKVKHKKSHARRQAAPACQPQAVAACQPVKAKRKRC